MSGENVIPLNFDAECILGSAEFVHALAERLARNEISTLSILAVDKNGEPIRFSMVPIGGPTLRLMMRGMIMDAVDDFHQGLDGKET